MMRLRGRDGDGGRGRCPAGGRHPRDRANRGPHRPHSGEAGDASDKERLAHARGFASSASSSARRRRWSSSHARSGARGPDSATPSIRRDAFLFTGPTGVGQDGARAAAGASPRQRVHPLRHERVHGEARGGAPHRSASRATSASSRAGLLVDAVRQHPYCVVLLDEIEKAHTDLFNILLQVMDHATLTDNTGRKADFRQAILIMTSNAGSREMSAARHRFRERLAPRTLRARPRRPVERSSRPEFRNRLDAVVSVRCLSAKR